MGKFWETYGHLGDYNICTEQAHDFELAIVSIDKTVRNSSNNFAGSGVAQSTERWQ